MFRFACLLLALVAACSGAAFPEDRIVGGRNARLGEVPWQVSLRNNNAHFCGGSIVNQRWILTAAHCLNPSQVARCTVVTNTLTLNSGGDVYRASRFILHPQYDSRTIRNDVGVVQVASNIVWRGNNVRPARMPTSAFTAVNARGVVSGWGRTSFPGSGANHLQFLDTIIVSQQQCAASSNLITPQNICTFTRNGQGTCHGDSGGPLTAGGVLIGIVSFGTPCARGVPDAYARVFSYISWIRGHTG